MPVLDLSESEDDDAVVGEAYDTLEARAHAYAVGIAFVIQRKLCWSESSMQNDGVNGALNDINRVRGKSRIFASSVCVRCLRKVTYSDPDDEGTFGYTCLPRGCRVGSAAYPRCVLLSLGPCAFFSAAADALPIAILLMLPTSWTCIAVALCIAISFAAG